MTYDEAFRIFQQCCGSMALEPAQILLNKKLIHKMAKGLNCNIGEEDNAEAILFRAISIIVKSGLA